MHNTGDANATHCLHMQTFGNSNTTALDVEAVIVSTETGPPPKQLAGPETRINH